MARALIKRVGQQSDNNGHKRTGPPCAFNQIGGCARGCVINPEHKYWIVFWGKKAALIELQWHEFIEMLFGRRWTTLAE